MTRILRRFFNRGDVDCRDTRELGSDFLEDDLPPQKRTALQVHLEKCGPCRAFIESLSSTIGMLTRLPKTTTPPSLKQSILDQTRKEDKGD